MSAGSPLFAPAVDAYHEARAVWLDLIDAAYRAAEEATRGNLLNRRGRERRIDPRTLFYGSHLRATAYASDELQEHWLEKPSSRMPWREFEQSYAAESRPCQCGGYAS